MGSEHFVMLASILQQLYALLSRGFHTTAGEEKVVRGLLTHSGDSDTSPAVISDMALAVPPSNPGAVEEVQAEKEELVNNHVSMLRLISAGSVSKEAAEQASNLTEGLLRPLQLRHKTLSKKRLGEWLGQSDGASVGLCERACVNGEVSSCPNACFYFVAAGFREGRGKLRA